MQEEAQLVGAPPKVVEVREANGLKWQWAMEIQPNFFEPGLIDGVLETVGMTVLYGPSSSGKTALAVDIAARIAAGRAWRGRETQGGLVVYMAAENSESTRRRFWAWMRRHKVQDLPVMVVVSPFTASERSIREMIKAIEEVAEEAGQPVRLVVFDTLARTIEGDENEADAMGKYVRCLDTVRDAFSCMVLVVHHTGKDERRGARGSSALRAATDHELAVEKKAGNARGTLTMAKVRDGDLEGQKFGFELIPIPLGRNRLGREVTTIVVDECELPQEKAKRGSAEARVEEALSELNGQRLTLDEFKEYVGDISTGKEASEKKAWRRLIENGAIELVDGFVS